MSKTTQLQIRVSPLEKARIQQLAKRAKMSVSKWVLSRVLSVENDLFQELVNGLSHSDKISFALAELNDFLTRLPGQRFIKAVALAPQSKLDPYPACYLAAMIEEAAAKKQVTPPSWVKDIPPLATPKFASELQSLRLHLLVNSPAAFRRRNIFIDTSIGGRV